MYTRKVNWGRKKEKMNVIVLENTLQSKQDQINNQNRVIFCLERDNDAAKDEFKIEEKKIEELKVEKGEAGQTHLEGKELYCH